MRLFALLLLLFPSLAYADGVKSIPIPESKKSIKDEFLTIFDGTSLDGWTVTGDVKLADGMVTIGGDKASKITWKHGYVPGWLSKVEQTKLGISRGAAPIKGPVEYSTLPGETRQLKEVRIRPNKGVELFNGKDLTGWKENMTKKASVFSVTKEGWLNVKNGPGDLQTESQYADFVLQLECISNGKHLNSGIFFRCIPEMYQQGYEAQIRNEWMGDDRTKPVDYGTGAIYRRVPARKVVSTDGEWFTMTVLAKGKRISTWVNGYPVVDWLDDRKEADNGRNGAKTSKGAISIQGHDATTDFSFRNIRILSLDEQPSK